MGYNRRAWNAMMARIACPQARTCAPGRVRRSVRAFRGQAWVVLGLSPLLPMEGAFRGCLWSAPFACPGWHGS